MQVGLNNIIPFNGIKLKNVVIAVTIAFAAIILLAKKIFSTKGELSIPDQKIKFKEARVRLIDVNEAPDDVNKIRSFQLKDLQKSQTDFPKGKPKFKRYLTVNQE